MQPDTLRAIIASTGLSQAEWARTVVGRDQRTVRRWLAGETIPPTTIDWLTRASVAASATNVVVTVVR
jgi:DNA-binding transcriptional regulator YiaG